MYITLQAQLMAARHLWEDMITCFSWGSLILLDSGDCLLEIPLRGIEANLMVATYHHVLVNMADFGDDLEI